MTKQRKIAGLAALGLAIVLYGVTRPSVLAEVGECRITDRDVRYRNRVLKIYFPDDTRSLGLEQLIRFCSYGAILARYGKPVTRDVLVVESKRIDENSKDTKTLRRVQSVFGSDEEAYLRDYVMPVYVERMIHAELFLKEPRIQRPAHAKAEGFLRRALAEPKAFCALAEKEGLECFSPEFSQALLTQIPQDGVYREVLDGEWKWLVVRRGKSKLDAVAFPKADYGQWLDAELARVEVRRH